MISGTAAAAVDYYLSEQLSRGVIKCEAGDSCRPTGNLRNNVTLFLVCVAVGGILRIYFRPTARVPGESYTLRIYQIPCKRYRCLLLFLLFIDKVCCLLVKTPSTSSVSLSIF